MNMSISMLVLWAPVPTGWYEESWMTAHAMGYIIGEALWRWEAWAFCVGREACLTVFQRETSPLSCRARSERALYPESSTLSTFQGCSLYKNLWRKDSPEQKQSLSLLARCSECKRPTENCPLNSRQLHTWVILMEKAVCLRRHCHEFRGWSHGLEGQWIRQPLSGIIREK